MPCYFPFYNDLQIPLPCGKCAYCIQRRIDNWVFRCMQEISHADTAHWVTLTYEVPPLTDNGFMTLRKPDVQNFFKRLRKRKRDFSRKKIKYYLCGEYGDTYYRPHYHAVVYNSSPEHIQSAWENFSSPLDPEGVILGICHFDEVNETTIAYTAKYMNKAKKVPIHFNDLRLPEFQLFSKGLGIGFLTEQAKNFYSADITRNYVTINGFKKPMPRYFMDKIVVCPVFKLAKQLFAQENSKKTLELQYAEWNENKTYHQTFEQYRYAKKQAHHDFYVSKILKRDKFK